MPAEPPANPTIRRCRGRFFAIAGRLEKIKELSMLPTLTKRVATMVLLLGVLPFIVVCSGSESTDPGSNPGTVSDLSVSAVATTSATITFTQVTDGAGQAANYDVRFAAAPISWGSATSVANGTCATPLAGNSVGSQITCSVLGLSPSTAYNFQVIAFRGTLNSDAVFGSESNIAVASTPAQP